MTREQAALSESRLTAGSSDDTPAATIQWIEQLVLLIRSKVDVPTATIHIRAYRDPQTAMGVDIVDARDAAYSMTILAQGRMAADDVEPIVTDLVEAIHIVGLLSRALDRPVTLW